MGEVWLAEQTEPIRRKVALKLIKAGMDTKKFIARFEAERQALALMDHPSIAKVFDAGTTPRGLPYFVMEYVQGEPITAYCDRHRLAIRDRLELFTQVCEAVQHAHQKGVIHRDLKPSNVLVAIQGDRPVPKIIDFGVAKATAQRLTERTMHTELGVLIGTAEYMSPEQAEMSGLDVDTRTDVYALGVTLYELLTGALPFDSRELRAAGFDEIRRRIREVDPPRPSTRVSGLRGASLESASRRRLEPAKLVGRLKGDLDWITMKALEKDRTRRYGSPNDLAMDIRRHLDDQPVLAGPPGAGYRLRKFARRHRIGVSFAALGALALAAFGATMAVQARRIANERNRAEQVSQFLTGLFTVSDPGRARGNSITAREVLDRGAEKIDRELQDQPEVQAQLLHTMGAVYEHLGLYPQAEPLLDRAVEIRQRILGPDDPLTLDSKAAVAHIRQVRGQWRGAEALYREVLEARRRILGEENPATLQAMSGVAFACQQQGRYQEAGEMFRRILEVRRRILGEDDPDTLWSMQDVANICRSRGRIDESVKLYEEVVRRRRRVQGDDHPSTMQTTTVLALLYTYQGRHAEAKRLLLEVLNQELRVLGNDHPLTLFARHSLASLYSEEGKYAEAERIRRETLERQRRVLGDEHPDSLLSMRMLAGDMIDQGRYAEAEQLYRDALAIQERLAGQEDAGTLGLMNGLAFLHATRGDHEQAETEYRHIVDIQVRARGREQFDTFLYESNRAANLRSLGRLVEAERMLQETLEFERRTLGEDYPLTLRTTRELAWVYSDQGRHADAARLLQDVLARERRILGEDKPQTLSTNALLGRVYARQGRFDDAEILLQETLQTQRRLGDENQPAVACTLFALGCNEALRAERAPALRHLRQAIDLGFPDVEAMLRSPELRSLQGDGAFQALVVAARRNADR